MSISLEDELTCCENLVAAFCRQHKKQVKLKYRIPATLMESKIPPYTIAILIENALKHGLCETKEHEIEVLANSNNHHHLQISLSGYKVPERLVIRKTLEPNHSKLYLFGLDETQIDTREVFITGSSNLTKAGLRTQNEFNVEISDYGYSDAASYFDSLWLTSVKITEFEDLREKLIQTLSEETLVKSISPFEAYLLVMKTYLDTFAQEDLGTNISELLLRNGYTPYKYQLDAVQQATGIIEKNNGVIIGTYRVLRVTR